MAIPTVLTQPRSKLSTHAKQICWLAGATSFGTRRVGREVLVDGRRKFIAYSSINVTEDFFSPVAYLSKDFPFETDGLMSGLLDGIHEYRAHFLSLCVKVSAATGLLNSSFPCIL